MGADYLGLLEIPGGGQVLVRTGSIIKGGGRVLVVDATRVQIDLPSGVIELVLQASGRPPTTPPAVGSVQPPRDEQNLMFRTVDPDRIADAPGRTAAADTRPTKPSLETARRLAPVLDLPPNSDVVAVNEQPVTSADAAIALIERLLADDIVVRLNLAGSNGGPETRVYLSPAKD